MATFEEEVNEIVANSTVDENGNLQLPEGTQASEQVLYAAKLEKRHRDTQGSYTKSQQQLKALKAENAKLAENWESDAVNSLTSKEQSKLDELKVQDPDAYIAEIAVIKDNAKVKFKEKKDALTKEINEMSELEVRESQLAAYNQANLDAQITDDSINSDVPPRIVKKLEKGEISFEEFLSEAKKYLTTGKKVKLDDKIEDEPDLNKSGGSDAPTDKALNSKSSSDYSKEVF